MGLDLEIDLFVLMGMRGFAVTIFWFLAGTGEYCEIQRGSVGVAGRRSGRVF
jgi:hypothetical protein